MRPALTRRTAVAVALLLAVAALSGCGRPVVARSLTPPPATSAPASQAVTATGVPTSSAAAGVPASATAGKVAKGKGLSANDAKALDAELSAIQGELDRLSVPSDSDFNGIGSGLK